MSFPATGFQPAAVEYVTVHGIALFQMSDGNYTLFTGSFGLSTPSPISIDYPRYFGSLCHGNEF